MVSVTVSVPEQIRELMKRFPEMNWSGFVREAIEKKAEELSWREEALKKLKQEEPLTKWAVELGRQAKKGRFEKVLAQLTPEERKKLSGD